MITSIKFRSAGYIIHAGFLNTTGTKINEITAGTISKISTEGNTNGTLSKLSANQLRKSGPPLGERKAITSPTELNIQGSKSDLVNRLLFSRVLSWVLTINTAQTHTGRRAFTHFLSH